MQVDWKLYEFVNHDKERLVNLKKQAEETDSFSAFNPETSTLEVSLSRLGCYLFPIHE